MCYNVPCLVDSREGQRPEQYSKYTFWDDFRGTRKISKSKLFLEIFYNSPPSISFYHFVKDISFILYAIYVWITSAILNHFRYYHFPLKVNEHLCYIPIFGNWIACFCCHGNLWFLGKKDLRLKKSNKKRKNVTQQHA